MRVFSGGDISIRNARGETLLHRAVIQGDAGIVQLLLSNNANVDGKSRHTQTLSSFLNEHRFEQNCNLCPYHFKCS